MSTNEPTAEQQVQAIADEMERIYDEATDEEAWPAMFDLMRERLHALLARAERAEAKLLKPSPISYDDLIQCPEKCAEYLKLHDAIIEDDDGIRTCADGTKRQTDRRLGYSLCWPHGVMLIGHKGCYPRAEKWAALFIYFWKYHKVPCDVLDEMLGELTGIHYVMEQRDEAIATAKEAHARIGAAIARAERAEAERDQAIADAKVLREQQATAIREAEERVRKELTPKPGHILDDSGKVRKVLGTLPVTADGCIIGGNAIVYASTRYGRPALLNGSVTELHVTKVGVTTLYQKTVYPQTFINRECYSTRAAAEAAKEAKQ